MVQAEANDADEGDGTLPLLPASFFERHLLEVAVELIGTELVWNGCSGLVVETEAYALEGDAACHTASRPSTRDFVARHPSGTAYVYLNYGIYWLLNVLVKGGPFDGIILIRALEPVMGMRRMRRRRRRLKATDLCSGPGKLSMALAIDGSHHGLRLTAAMKEADGGHAGRGFRCRRAASQPQILQDTRIGISKATELPWRFLLKDSPHLSVRPSAAATAACPIAAG